MRYKDTVSDTVKFCGALHVIRFYRARDIFIKIC